MFPQTISDINQGAAVAELNAALTQVAVAVRQTGKAGSLTFTIKMSPANKRTPEWLAVETDIKAKIPESERAVTIFYATEDGQLLRHDPRQRQLPLRSVDLEPQREELKEAI